MLLILLVLLELVQTTELHFHKGVECIPLLKHPQFQVQSVLQPHLVRSTITALVAGSERHITGLYTPSSSFQSFCSIQSIGGSVGQVSLYDLSRLVM